MKRLLTLIAAAALVLSASAAMAATGVSGTAHQFATVSYGLCQVCHVPHAAGGSKRLWRDSVSPAPNGTWANSTVGTLCGTCHNGGNGKAWTNNAAVGGKAASQTNGPLPFGTAGAITHGRSLAVLAGGAGNIGDTLTGNGKPYLSSVAGKQPEPGLIECTSCHNPHDGTIRPFLRPGAAANSASSISGVCADCHDRYNTNVGANNHQLWNGGQNVSMHPVDVSYANIGANGPTTLRTTPAGNIIKLVNGLSNWSLGGKFQNNAAGGLMASAPANFVGNSAIGCQTCHAVHNPAASTEASLHLLAIDNVGGATAALCEGCHGGPGNKALGAYSSVGTGADHPIDASLAVPTVTIDKWYNGASTNLRYERHSAGADDWPRSGLVAHATAGGNIICVSCHSAHAGRPAHNLTRRGATGIDDATGDFCLACHSDASPIGHHSNTANYVPSAVKCQDCHGTGGFSGAHNGFGYTRFGPWNGVATNQSSELCVTCHTGGTSDPFFGDLHLSGTGAGRTNPNSIPNGYLGAAQSTDGSTSRTHYLGTFTNGANAINVKRTAWNGVGYSKFGGADTHGLSTDASGNNLICESCHSLLGNIGRPSNGLGITANASSGYMNNLLLQDYKDDGAPVGGGNAVVAQGAVGSGLCIGCHNQKLPVAGTAGSVADSNDTDKATTPPSMHPMTNWSITKAADAGRSPSTLITTAGSYADNSGRTVKYPADNQMTCDTCHRPHNAASNGSDFATGGGTWTPTWRTAPVSVILEVTDTTNGKYDALCSNCHAY